MEGVLAVIRLSGMTVKNVPNVIKKKEKVFAFVLSHDFSTKSKKEKKNFTLHALIMTR